MRLIKIGVVAMLWVAACQPSAVPPSPAPAPRVAPTATLTILPALEASPVPTLTSIAKTGIRITATIGPTCPGPQREGQVCTGPYSGEFTLTDRAGNEIARFSTDADGHFAVDLPPGDYQLALVTAGGRSGPHGGPVEVSVVDGQVVEVTIELDTGMR